MKAFWEFLRLLLLLSACALLLISIVLAMRGDYPNATYDLLLAAGSLVLSKDRE